MTNVGIPFKPFKTMVKTAVLGALLMGLSAAQPGPGSPVPQTPTPPTPGGVTVPVPPAFNPSYTSYREAERAGRAIEKAIRTSYELEYYLGYNQTATLSDDAEGLVSLARELLQEAQSAFGEQAFFEARRKAEAAEKLYKGLEKLYLSPYRAGKRGKGPDLFAVRERLTRLELELDYYDLGDTRVPQLVDLASQYYQRGINQMSYAFLEAADEIIKAAEKLLEAVRGF